MKKFLILVMGVCLSYIAPLILVYVQARRPIRIKRASEIT